MRFQLKSQPFSEHVAPTSLWVDTRMQEGLARLNDLVDHAALGLVTGPTGAGKSALLKRFLHDLSQHREGRFTFVCPPCGEMDSAVKRDTNLGRCFHCATNFNPIDFVMHAREYDFVRAVTFLSPLLPP